jgi:hypothetical protein
MKKAITVLFTITSIGFLLVSTTFTVQGAQNEGSAWVLVEVIDIDASEEIASANENSESYHMEGKFWSVEQFSCTCRL